MGDVPQVASYIALGVALAAGVTALVSMFKAKPLDKEKFSIVAAPAVLDITGDAFALVAGQFTDEFKRLIKEKADERKHFLNEIARIQIEQRDSRGMHVEDMAQVRREFAQYRDDAERQLAETAALLRAAQAEIQTKTRHIEALEIDREAIKRENDDLRDRVSDLETEVKGLKQQLAN